jgi:cytochrome P450
VTATVGGAATDAAAEVAAYLRDTSSSRDPYPAYRRLRETAPVHWSDENGYWIITGFPEAELLLRDPRLSRHEAGRRQFGWLSGPDDPPEVARAVHAWLSTVLNLDPPEHTRLRQLMARAFSPRAVSVWQARTEAVVDDVLAGLRGRERIDLVADVGYPVAETVICEVLGVPAEDHDRWKQWASGLNQGAIFAGTWKPGVRYPEEPLRRAQQSVVHWYEYFDELVRQRRASNGSDLITTLVRLEEEGDRLTETELIGTLILLIGAGHDTTANLIANGMLALLRHPGEHQRLRDDPALAAGAVEEVLRYDGSARSQPRVATADIEVAGHTIRGGELVMISVNAANRDPRRFAEPERFDITRADTGHLAFASGIHFCLGAALARMEVATAFRKIATLPVRFELDGAPLEYKRSHGRNLVALPVHVTSLA